MPTQTLAPVSVAPYARDYVIEVVRHTTGWNDRGEVHIKAQLNYLCSYLEVDHIDCKTIVVENDYIDRHYLEDYAEYYSRCFPSHPRKCARLHFFGIEFTENNFEEGLQKCDEKFFSELQESYIGFVVLRPIPQTVFAKICLRPYLALTQRTNTQIITREVEVSLFGVPLRIHAAPFLEQDKVVSACATSAVWVSLAARSELPYSALPSPSKITRAATSGGSDYTRTFPTSGLSPEQVMRALKFFGYEPDTVRLDGCDDLEELRNQVYSYSSFGIPVIVGGAVYQHIDGETELLGDHLVSVVGFNVNMTATPSSGLPKNVADRVDKVYVHDDRIGPYVRMALEKCAIPGAHEHDFGLPLSIQNGEAYIFVPEVAIAGLPPKVRNQSNAIYEILWSLTDFMENIKGDIEIYLERDLAMETAAANKKWLEGIYIVTSGEWKIQLMLSSVYKHELMGEQRFCAADGAPEKNSLLLRNLPRYVWRCRCVAMESGLEQPICDLLFDATEVLQGRMLLSIVSYDERAQVGWNYIEKCVLEGELAKYAAISRESTTLGAIGRFFSDNSNKSYLNTLYGPLGLPRRPLKPGETDSTSNIARRTDILTLRRGGNDSNTVPLDSSKKYIWVINELGDIVIGEDIVVDNDFKGHPTLVDSKPGRIAGELYYSEKRGKWQLNAKSRAYSAHVRAELKDFYLKAVCDHNLTALAPEIEHSANT